MAAQGASEFWNVCTRPAAARGGLGLTVAATDLHLAHPESYIAVQFDSSASYGIW